jgi:hypothetical protein
MIVFHSDQPQIEQIHTTKIVSEKSNSEHPNSLGICDIVNVGPNGTGQGDIFPVLYVNSYYFKVKNRNEDKITDANARVKIITPPKHGQVSPVMDDDDLRNPRYIPTDGFQGNDSFTLQVKNNNYSVNLNYFFYVTNDDGISFNPNKYCKGHTWIISFYELHNENYKKYSYSDYMQTIHIRYNQNQV